jgi:hypothetical protein
MERGIGRDSRSVRHLPMLLLALFLLRYARTREGCWDSGETC